jgi:hypothetical protein
LLPSSGLMTLGGALASLLFINLLCPAIAHVPPCYPCQETSGGTHTTIT